MRFLWCYLINESFLCHRILIWKGKRIFLKLRILVVNESLCFTILARFMVTWPISVPDLPLSGATSGDIVWKSREFSKIMEHSLFGYLSCNSARRFQILSILPHFVGSLLPDFPAPTLQIDWRFHELFISFQIFQVHSTYLFKWSVLIFVWYKQLI